MSKISDAIQKPTEDGKTEDHHGKNDLLAKFNMDDILNCMHCGFCLPSCPTYRETGMEFASPRGRIQLMKGVATGQLDVDKEFAENMFFCLGCRACETACPAGVPYGKLVETAREVVQLHNEQKGNVSFVQKWIYRHLFPYPSRLKKLGHLLWFLQVTGMQKWAGKLGLTKLLPRPMAEMQEAVEPIASSLKRRKRKAFLPAEKKGNITVGLFTGCVMDILYHEINEATARVLSKAGCNVVFVKGQVCCGALHAHSGERITAEQLAKQNIQAFENTKVDFIINNAGGCGASLKEYVHWLEHDPDWNDRAQAFVAKVRDVNEFLAELGDLPFTKTLPLRVTYQDSCHLAHGQGVRNQPRQLIRQIPGVEFIEQKNADHCCGSAGIYNITHYETSMSILDEKMKNVQETRADVVVTSNPGCLLQMKHGIVRSGLKGRMQAMHIMELLDRAL